MHERNKHMAQTLILIAASISAPSHIASRKRRAILSFDDPRVAQLRRRQRFDNSRDIEILQWRQQVASSQRGL